MIVQFLVVIPAILAKKPELLDQLLDRRGFLQFILGWLELDGTSCLNPDKRRPDFFSGSIYQSAKPTESELYEDSVSDTQYILQTLTEIEHRLAKVEDSISRQGEDIWI